MAAEHLAAPALRVGVAGAAPLQPALEWALVAGAGSGGGRCSAEDAAAGRRIPDVAALLRGGGAAAAAGLSRAEAVAATLYSGPMVRPPLPQPPITALAPQPPPVRHKARRVPEGPG